MIKSTLYFHTMLWLFHSHLIVILIVLCGVLLLLVLTMFCTIQNLDFLSISNIKSFIYDDFHHKEFNGCFNQLRTWNPMYYQLLFLLVKSYFLVCHTILIFSVHFFFTLCSHFRLQIGFWLVLGSCPRKSECF